MYQLGGLQRIENFSPAMMVVISLQEDKSVYTVTTEVIGDYGEMI